MGDKKDEKADGDKKDEEAPAKDDTSSKVETLKTQITEHEAHIKAVTKQLEEVQEEKKKAAKEEKFKLAKELKTKASVLEKSIPEMQQKLKDLEAELAEIKPAKEEL